MGERQGRKQPRPVTAERLERAALRHLERYAATSGELRRVLLRRVARSAALHGTDPAAGAETVERLLGKLTHAGLLDDAARAEGRARSLAERGTSTRGIRARLTRAGLAAEEIERGLAARKAASRGLDPELAAAARFARRRRLGPFRPAEEREARRARDFAALARQGFSLELARRVLEVENEETLLALLTEGED